MLKSPYHVVEKVHAGCEESCLLDAGEEAITDQTAAVVATNSQHNLWTPRLLVYYRQLEIYNYLCESTQTLSGYHSIWHPGHLGTSHF